MSIVHVFAGLTIWLDKELAFFSLGETIYSDLSIH